MASGQERRMLFDIRGRRKNVIRVVYACLALLMGASLFVAVGPFNIAEFFGNGSSTSAAELSEEQAERIEQRLVKSPDDPNLLLQLTRSRISAGQALAEQNPTTGTFTPTEESIEQYELAKESWNRYAKQAGAEVNPNAASLVATTFFTVAENSTELAAIEENVAAATRAQRAAAEASPDLNSLSTLAIFEYFNGEFEKGDETADKAAAEASSKSQRKEAEKRLDSIRKSAEGWQKRREKAAKQQAKAGKEQLENPFGGLSGGTGLAP
jgi:hypothetical protein